MATARVTFRVTVRGPAAGEGGASPAPAPPESSSIVLGGDAPELGGFDTDRAIPLVRIDPSTAFDGPLSPGTSVWATTKPLLLRRNVAVQYA